MATASPDEGVLACTEVSQVRYPGPSEAVSCLQIATINNIPMTQTLVVSNPGAGFALTTVTPSAGANTVQTAVPDPAANGFSSKATGTYTDGSTPSLSRSSASPTSNASQTANGVSASGSSLTATSSKGLAAGPVAGIAIGCAIAGAAIAALVLLLLFRRRKDRQHNGNGYQSVTDLQQEKMLAAPMTSMAIGSAATIVESNLPPAAPDATISDEMAILNRVVKSHVQDYYDLDHDLPAEVNQSMIVALGSNLQIPASTLNGWLAHPGTRRYAIQFCLAWAIFSRAGFGHDINPEISFLPPEVASCIVTMSSMEHDPRARLSFLSQWKRVTAALMHKPYIQNAFTNSDARKPRIDRALKALDAILAPFQSPRVSPEERHHDLEEVLKRSAKFAFLLFSHPNAWTFDWEGDEDDSLVIFPALHQIADETGQLLVAPRSFTPKEAVRM